MKRKVSTEVAREVANIHSGPSLSHEEATPARANDDDDIWKSLRDAARKAIRILDEGMSGNMLPRELHGKINSASTALSVWARVTNNAPLAEEKAPAVVADMPPEQRIEALRAVIREDPDIQEALRMEGWRKR